MAALGEWGEEKRTSIRMYRTNKGQRLKEFSVWSPWLRINAASNYCALYSAHVSLSTLVICKYVQCKSFSLSIFENGPEAVRN